jgi:hypothetical protein
MAEANYKPRIPLIAENSRNSNAQSPYLWSSYRMVPYKPLSANVAPSPLLFSELRFRPIRSSPVPPSPVAQSFQLSPVPKVSPSPVARSMFRTPVPPSPSPPQLITSLEEEPFLTNNNFANNQATIIPDRAEVVVIRTSDLTSREKDKIFAMYNRTYRNAGYSQRFNTPAELFKKYPCIYAVKRYYTRAFVLVQHRIYYNKISGVCHNNTPLGKELMWFIIKTLLNQPGALIEASGTVSWLIRKKKLAPIITDPDIIRWALDLPDTLFEFTPNYDINNKDNQYYTRTTVIENEDGDIIGYDVKTETLFGTPLGCIFKGDDCTRVCATHIQLSNAGRRKSNKYKRKMAHNTKKHKKH